jgi:hypothetical protein
MPFFCYIPELNLDVSAIIKDSPYAPLASSEWKVKRAEESGMGWVHHRDTKVRVGDVAAEKEVGHIAVGLTTYASRVGSKAKRRYD